jgi:heat shock protein HslJ
MTDDLDVQLRDAFAAEAERAPAVGDLAGAARRRAGTQRRRRMLEVAAVAAVVLALVAGVTVWVGGSAEPGPELAVGPTSSTAPVDGADGVLAFRGVEVPVPKAWLDPANLACGTALVDAAYVVVPPNPTRACQPVVENPVTEVVLQPWEMSEPYAAPAAGERVMSDGRTQLVGRVPGSDVRLIVSSADPALARRLFDSAHLTDGSAGCDGLSVQLLGPGGQTVKLGGSQDFPVSPDNTMALRIGDQISVDATGPCATEVSLSSTARSILVHTADPGTLRAARSGSTSIEVLIPMCAGVADPQCIGGAARTGSVGVTVGPASPIVGTWRLVAVRGAPYEWTRAAGGHDYDLTIGPDGHFGGSDGCNAIGGTYQVTGNRVTFQGGPLFDVGCNNVPHEQALNNAATFAVTGDDLLLYDGAGSELAVYQRVAE